MKTKDEMMKEFEELENSENCDIFMDYINAILDGDVDKAFNITFKVYGMFSTETLAQMTYVINKVSMKIEDYYLEHENDENNEFIRKTEEILDLMDKYDEEEP